MKSIFFKLTMAMAVGFSFLFSNVSAGHDDMIALVHDQLVGDAEIDACHCPFFEKYDLTIAQRHMKVIQFILYSTLNPRQLDKVFPAMLAAARNLPKQTNGVGQTLTRVFNNFYGSRNSEATKKDLLEAFDVFGQKFLDSINPRVKEVLPEEYNEVAVKLKRALKAFAHVIIKIKNSGVLLKQFDPQNVEEFDFHALTTSEADDAAQDTCEAIFGTLCTAAMLFPFCGC